MFRRLSGGPAVPAPASPPPAPPTHQEAVIVFARLPRLGRVKTRLAAGVGPAAALALYEHLACNALLQAAQCGSSAFLSLSDAADLDGSAEWLARLGLAGVVSVDAQCDDDDLGARLQASFTLAFSRGAQRVLVCGSDVPDLDAAVLRSALHLLLSSDAVLGASPDGGFYLVGLRAPPPPSLFAGVPWSTSEACEGVRLRAEAAQLTVDTRSLPPLRDIDTRADLASWRDAPSSSRSPQLAAAADAALAAGS